jgi:hypothetical protein
MVSGATEEERGQAARFERDDGMVHEDDVVIPLFR